MSKITREYALTPNRTYQVTMDSHQGSFSIGLIGMDKDLFDVLIEPNQRMNWDAFNDDDTKNTSLAGDLPRWFSYYGNDTGFIDWSSKRLIEDFTWCPQGDVQADFSQANIRTLSIINHHQCSLVLPKNFYRLTLRGDLSAFDIQGSISHLSFLNLRPTLDKLDNAYQITFYPVFVQQKYLNVVGDIGKQAIDCKSLLAYQELESLSLSGYFINLQVLSELKHLKYLSLRNMPDLSSLTDLTAFHQLNSLSIYFADEQGGKRLKQQLKLNKNLSLQEVSICQLKKPSWFMIEYMMPFRTWKTKNLKQASKYYKSSITQLNKQTDIEIIKSIIIEFVKAFNILDDIETTEREDIATAVLQLIEVPDVKIDHAQALQWFDEYRDY